MRIIPIVFSSHPDRIYTDVCGGDHRLRKPNRRDFPFNFLNGTPARVDTIFEALLYNSNPIIPRFHLNFNNFPAGSADFDAIRVDTSAESYIISLWQIKSAYSYE